MHRGSYLVVVKVPHWKLHITKQTRPVRVGKSVFNLLFRLIPLALSFDITLSMYFPPRQGQTGYLNLLRTSHESRRLEVERVQQVEIEISIDGIDIRRKVNIEIESTIRCLARRQHWRCVKGMVQHVLYNGLAGTAQITIRCGRTDPVQETAQEAQLLDDTGASDPLDWRVLEGWLEELIAEDPTSRGCEGHDLFERVSFALGVDKYSGSKRGLQCGITQLTSHSKSPWSPASRSMCVQNTSVTETISKLTFSSSALLSCPHCTSRRVIKNRFWRCSSRTRIFI